MKRFSILSAAILLVGIATSGLAAWPSESSAVLLKGGETPEQIQEAYGKAIASLAPDLGYGKNSTKALQKFEATVHHAARPGAEAERLACCQAVAVALQSDASVDAKVWMLNLIEFVGQAELVSAEAKLLEAAEPLLHESARGALQHNPVPAAAAALRGALAKATDPQWQAALALALGTRQDAASVPMIAKLLRAKDESVLTAALFALGSIANADATKALAGAQKSVPETLRAAAAESYLKCAEQLFKDGKASAAKKIYREVYQPQQPRPIRLAALQGVLKTSSDDEAASRLLQILFGNDADARAIAAGAILDLPSGVLKSLASDIDKLPPVLVPTILGMMAERGEKSALPMARFFAKSDDEAVCLAALNALGRLGDASTVPLLVETMQAGGNHASAAKESLLRLDGAGVNDAIITAMQDESEAGRRADMISVIESRGASVAAPALLKELGSDKATVRRAALHALAKLAEPKELPTMLSALLKSTPGSERDDAEKAIASVCARVPDASQQADPVLASYRAASAAEQAILLPVLGRLGGAKAFEVVKTALAGSDVATTKAAETALANWPDADENVEAELLSLAQHAAQPDERAAALRAYIRVIALPSGLPEPAKLKKFQKAMELAEQNPERNQILERVTELRRIETLRFVVTYLEQPALAVRAGNTICELAKERGLRDRNQAEFERALNKIIEVCQDQSVVDRAKRRLQEK